MDELIDVCVKNMVNESFTEEPVSYTHLYEEKMGKAFPQDPGEQLMEAVKAVFRSWDNERAKMCIRDSSYSEENSMPGITSMGLPAAAAMASSIPAVVS